MVTRQVGTLRFGKKAVSAQDCTCSILPEPLENVRCGFRVEFISVNHRYSTMMCDYVSAGNELLYDEDYFNLFLPIQ